MKKEQLISDIIEGRHIGGFVTVEAIRDSGDGPKVIARRRVHNLVLNTGKRQIWRSAMGQNLNVFDQYRVGTCGVASNSAQTNVVSPVTGTLKTIDLITLLAGTRTVQVVMSLPSGAGSKSAASIQEVCILNSNTSPGGSALMRAVFSPVNKDTSVKLRLTYTARVL